MARLLVTVGALLVCAAAAPAADASTLVNRDGVLTFTAAPGVANSVHFFGASPTSVSVVSFDDPAEPSGCTAHENGYHQCEGVTSVIVLAGDGDDAVHSYELELP